MFAFVRSVSGGEIFEAVIGADTKKSYEEKYMSKKNAPKKTSLLDRCLTAVEIAGNKLPHPVTLFACLALFVVILSAVLAAFGVSATGMLVSGGELTETTVTAVSLLTKDGLAYIFSNAVNNFTTYAPLGMVLVAMLGVGVAEESGMINTLLKKAVKVTPVKLLSPMMVFLGIKNIRLGPTLPAFISPNVLNFLVEKFAIAPISTPEEDIAAILGENR